MIIIYSLDATRCVILHLAATQSLRHIWPAAEQPPLWQCGAAVLVGAALLAQVRLYAVLGGVVEPGVPHISELAGQHQAAVNAAM
jgi:hypothetical protein